MAIDHRTIVPDGCAPSTEKTLVMVPERMHAMTLYSDRITADASFASALELKKTLQLLIVGDDQAQRDVCDRLLRSEGYSPVVVGRPDEAVALVRLQRFDLILVDLSMTSMSGMEILREALAAHPDTLVVMTGNASAGASLAALQAGAWEFLPRPLDGAHLLVLMARVVHAVQVTRETRAMRRPPEVMGEEGQLVGVAPAFRHGVELARRVAATDASIMISGESGTGKEVIAQLIHRSSRRASRSLVPISCAAVPESLLDSELFGHRKGAFTGADRDKPGLFETANGGTLLLDELTHMPPSLQAKLLRVLQDGVVRRVGSEYVDAVVDVRLISAIDCDPRDAVSRGVLREDLCYRLRVVQIDLPPLRQRREDIPLLAEHFLKLYWSRHRAANQAPPHLSAAAAERLRGQMWTGNVRELQNVIEHVAVLAEPGQEIRPGDLPLAAPDLALGAFPALFVRGMLDDTYHLAKEHVISRFEREYVSRLVSRAEGNISRAARLAGVDRTTLYRLIDRHSLERLERPRIAEQR